MTLPFAPNDQTHLILERLNDLEAALRPPSGVTIHWRIGPVTRQQTPPTAGTATTVSPPTERTTPMADLVLTADDQARLAASGQDADGNPVALAGQLTYAVDNTSVLTLTDNGDGTALIVTTGPTGSALVTASADNAIGSLAVDVVAGDVASIQISATVEPQGTPTP
jgi:hypothetical protein